MDIYIKPMKKAAIAERRLVYLKDVAEVVAKQDMVEKIKNLIVLEMTANRKQCYLVSVTDLIQVIHNRFPDCTVNNVGEKDTVVDFSPKKKKDNTILKWSKIVFVMIVLFTGSATAIMSFYSDAQMAQIFDTVSYLLYRDTSMSKWFIEVPFSFGLAIGIIVFFNHFAGKKITNDPTPIEVEMSLYEQDANDTMIDNLNANPLKEGK